MEISLRICPEIPFPNSTAPWPENNHGLFSIWKTFGVTSHVKITSPSSSGASLPAPIRTSLGRDTPEEKQTNKKTTSQVQDLWGWGWGTSRFSLSTVRAKVEKDVATHCSVLTWRIPRTEEPGGLQSMGSQRVGHDRVTQLNSKEGSREPQTQ